MEIYIQWRIKLQCHMYYRIAENKGVVWQHRNEMCGSAGLIKVKKMFY
jgi:hypothetical protein